MAAVISHSRSACSGALYKHQTDGDLIHICPTGYAQMKTALHSVRSLSLLNDGVLNYEPSQVSSRRCDRHSDCRLLRFRSDRFASFESIGASRDWLVGHYERSPFLVTVAFFATYVISAALSIPVAAVMTLLAGAIFGVVAGTSNCLLRLNYRCNAGLYRCQICFAGLVQQRFATNLAAINRGIEREGGFYLFALRLVPVFPFFAVNLLMALTPMRVITFAGEPTRMLPGTAVYVNAGLEIATLGRREISCLLAFSAPLCCWESCP